MRRTVTQRFDEKWELEPGGSCWLWIASTTGKGYGQFRDENGKMVGAHQFSFRHFKGPIPKGLEPDHLCETRPCVNPDHLEAVTRRVNLLRGATIAARNAAKTRCPKGHSYDVENTYLDPKGIRHCRECGRAVMRRLYARKRGQ